MTDIWSGEPFSGNPVTDLRTMLAFEFMRNAFEAGTVIALVAAIIGYFVVLRRSAFATHALGHTGFSGAAAAVLVGAPPVYGLLLFTMFAGSAMGVLGNRASNRDVEIGTVLAFALGLGLLFLSLYQGYATEAYSILFGEVLGISASGVVFTVWAGVAVLAVFAIIYRPLLFASLDEDVAEAKGMPMLFLGLAFLLLLAVTISIAVQIIGVLLIFALMVTPAAIAVRLTHRVGTAVLAAIVISVSATWAGLFIGFYVNAPVSFFITGIIFGEYLVVRGLGVVRASPLLRAVDVPETDGIRSLRNAAIAGTISQALLVASGALFVQSLLHTSFAPWDLGGLWAHARSSVVLLALGLAVAATAALLYLSGFRKMASASREFTPPAFLALNGLIGLVLSVGGFGLLVEGLALNSTGYALAPVMILFGAPTLTIGVAFALVGLVGQAVGSWRVGLRYRDRALRSGAVLMAIPIAGNAVAVLGYQRALARPPAEGTGARPAVAR